MAIIPALCPVLVDTTLAAAAASVSMTVPAGYEILFLEYHELTGTNEGNTWARLTFNADGGANYDDSAFIAFGTASSTTNAQTSIEMGYMRATGGDEIVSDGFLTIFNRLAQEKVIIGTYARRYPPAQDQLGYHKEAKWRNTTAEISTITLTASTGNLTTPTRFILRGLRIAGAPGLGSADIVQFIGSATATGASVILPTIPAGYGMLWLFWHDVYGDQTALQDIRLALIVLGTCDYSSQAFGTASSTTNAAAFIIIGQCGDVDSNGADGEHQYSSGSATIFNRKAQEKVVIGTEAFYYDATAATAPQDVVGYHIEGKDRTVAGEISLMVLSPSAGNFAGTGKIWVFGVKIP